MSPVITFRISDKIHTHALFFVEQAKSRVASSWRDSIKPDQRHRERTDLQRLNAKVEYLRNPRNIPPSSYPILTKTDKNKSKKISTEEQSKTRYCFFDIFSLCYLFISMHDLVILSHMQSYILPSFLLVLYAFMIIFPKQLNYSLFITFFIPAPLPSDTHCYSYLIQSSLIQPFFFPIVLNMFMSILSLVVCLYSFFSRAHISGLHNIHLAKICSLV